MFKYKIIGSVMAVAMMINFLVGIKFNAPEEETEKEEISENISKDDRPYRKSQTNNRTPASQKNSQPQREINKPDIARAELDKSNFEEVPAPEGSNNTPIVSGGYRSNRMPTSIPLIRDSANDKIFELPKAGKTAETVFKKDEKIVCTGPGCSPIAPLCPGPTCPTGLLPSESTLPDPGVGGDGGILPTPNVCSSNITGGAFSNPIGVTLNCSSISTIKYCLELDTGAGCCDPHATGVTYSSQIILGPANGNYCLSYYGESASSGASVDYQQSYTINSTLPNLLVAHPQIYYQTNQLVGKSIINSSDFGKAGYYIGQVNLKSHNPGPANLNLDCEQIVTNYVSLTTPDPLSILSMLDVSLDNPAVQIEIPLRLDQLSYGDNFITSFIADNNFVTPIYACSTSKVVLFDFEFFQGELAFGDIGDNSVREFTGGFSSFGFFEDESTFLSLTRAPAGESTEDNSGQKLEYGMFGILY